MNETLRARLKQRLQEPGLVVAPGVFDMVSLRLADSFGFDALYMTGFGTVAVIVLTFDYGQPPWIALILAGSFGIYGLAKNKIGGRVTAVNSFAMEAGMLLPLAGVQIAILAATAGQIGGGIQFGHVGFWGTIGLIFFGLLTAVPLIMFGTAAQLLPLRFLGFIQYTTPILQFCLALFVLGEPMPAARWVGFVLVWIGLAVLIFDALRRNRVSVTNS